MILQQGLVTKHHMLADDRYANIGHTEIIDVRSNTMVRLPDYGLMGEYVPFYFTPRSIMLYNIVTGYRVPEVPQINRSKLLVIRCLIDRLIQLPRWFFTDGQGNDMATKHYNDLKQLDQIDWHSIQRSNFSKSNEDYDRPRRYQAEFLVHQEVPITHIESLHVVDQSAANQVQATLEQNQSSLAVHVTPHYFFP
jgi:hypothetical protein